MTPIKTKQAEINTEIYVSCIAGQIEIMLPIRTVSESNTTEHWFKKATRHTKQKGIVRCFLEKIKDNVHFPCELVITRYAPRRLDKHDNLPMSLKWIVDACCESITGEKVAGRADDSEYIKISYQQVVNKLYGVKILVKWNAVDT